MSRRRRGAVAALAAKYRAVGPDHDEATKSKGPRTCAATQASSQAACRGHDMSPPVSGAVRPMHVGDEVVEVGLTDEGAEERVDDVRCQRGDDGSEGCADDDGDCQVHHVAAKNEIAKTLELGRLLLG